MDNSATIGSSVTLAVFETSPDAGHPDCLCSYCSERIEASDDAGSYDRATNTFQSSAVIRIWPVFDGVTREVRFHPQCFAECQQLGLIVEK
jgi:hypothetical protein